MIGAVLLACGAFFVLGGCAGDTGLRTGGSPNREAGSSLRAAGTIIIPGVPFLPQEEDTCGPSSLAMLLSFLGSDVQTGEIVRETRTAGLRGTLITDLAVAARRRGYSAEVVDLDITGLRERIAGGTPVILLVDLGVWVFARPHFLLVFGVTPDGVVAHSGRDRGTMIPYATLSAQWAKMGNLALVVERVQG